MSNDVRTVPVQNSSTAGEGWIRVHRILLGRIHCLVEERGMLGYMKD